MTNTVTKLLTAIARQQLCIPTLKTRRSDSLDFHEVAVWQLKSALEAAFDAGARSASSTSPSAPGLPTEESEIAIGWAIEDVQSVRPDLNDDQARQVLQAVERNHDATIGINWDVIGCHADMLFGCAPETDEAEEAI
jgi:hypothetical protein